MHVYLTELSYQENIETWQISQYIKTTNLVLI